MNHLYTAGFFLMSDMAGNNFQHNFAAAETRKRTGRNFVFVWDEYMGGRGYIQVGENSVHFMFVELRSSPGTGVYQNGFRFSCPGFHLNLPMALSNPCMDLLITSSSTQNAILKCPGLPKPAPGTTSTSSSCSACTKRMSSPPGALGKR